jgi:hypothetical protein
MSVAISFGPVLVGDRRGCTLTVCMRRFERSSVDGRSFAPHDLEHDGASESETLCRRDATGDKHRRYLRPIGPAPYFLIRGTVGFFNTIGGLRVDQPLRALSDHGEVVPGLYAAGVDAGGWQRATYNFPGGACLASRSTWAVSRHWTC